jgi:glyoxylase-like metal-dependent hydrolase (beta-lactamase superfamily II)
VLRGGHAAAAADGTRSILTHRHGDHVNGLPSVLELLARLRSEDGGAASSIDTDDTTAGPPRLHKFPDPATDAALVEKLQALPAGSYTVHNSPAGPSPLHPLAHGDVLHVGAEDDASTLEVLHSPGHTTDHVALLLREEHALLTGDNVLGQGTSVFEDLKAYISSLRLMKEALVTSGASPHLEEENRLYPAHGPHMDNGRVTLERYVEHRLAREAQLLELLRKTPPEDDDSWTIRSLVATLYAGYPEGLYLPAARGIWLHLQKLAHDGAEGAAHMRGQRLSCTNDAEMDDLKLEGENRWLLAMDQKWRLSEAVKM